MKLRKIGPNATVLEVEWGEILFSYESPAALKYGKDGLIYTLFLDGRMTRATRAHIARFISSSIYAPIQTSPKELGARIREVLNG